MPEESRVCSGCGLEKSLILFSSNLDRVRRRKVGRCLLCRSEAAKNLTPEQRAAINARRNSKYIRRPPRIKVKTWMGAVEYGRRYRQVNKRRLNENTRIRIRNRLRTDPHFRLLHYLRSRPYRALLGSKKESKTLEYLGIPVDQFRDYLEAKFYSGMTWDNYGPVWHLDHIKPLCSFDLTQESERKIALHWSNHQPLLATDNLRKGARITC